jgi:ATP-dependent DNA helicase 2 subunit 1
MALEEDILENPIDKTMPRFRQIDKRCGEYIEDYGHELEAAFAQQSKNTMVSATQEGTLLDRRLSVT